MGCCGFQYAAGGSFAKNVCDLLRANPKSTDRWFGTAVDSAEFPQNSALRLLSGPTTDLVEAHKIAQRGERVVRELRRDGAWFIGQGMVPPWMIV